MDDILVYGQVQDGYNQRLTAVLEHIKQAKVKLNKEKCSFYMHSIRFLGQHVDGSGIHPDPQKVEAVQLMKSPTSLSEAWRFLGMANQLGKITPSLAEVTTNL